MHFDFGVSEDVIEKLRSSFLEEAAEKMQNLADMIDSLWNDRSQSAEIMNRFLGDVHSLKGMGGTFGYPQITITCHNLESFLEGVTDLTDPHLDGLQVFMDHLQVGLDVWPTPDDETIKAMLLDLPKPLNAAPATTEPLSIGKVLLVCPNPSIRQLAEFFLDDFGLEVTVLDNPIDAFKVAIENNFNFVISSVEMNGLTGIELITALKSTKAMRNAHFALLTASSDAGALVAGVPEGVAIISTQNMEKGIEHTLDRFGL